MNRCSAFLFILLLANPALAAVFTVGPGGTHASVQAAIAAAIAAPGADEIRIADATFNEVLFFSASNNAGVINISGGWNTTFTAADGQPSVIDAGQVDRVADFSLGSGDLLWMSDLVFRNGHASMGAGLLVQLNGDSSMRIANCEISDNTAEADRAEGAGLRVTATGTSQFELLDSNVTRNHVLCTGDIDCRDGGLGLLASDTAQIAIRRSQFRFNTVEIASGSGLAGGADLSLSDMSSLQFEDNFVIGNTVTATATGAVGVGLAIGGSGAIVVQRNRIRLNTVAASVPTQHFQMSFYQYGDQTSLLSDSVIADGNGKGLYAIVSGGGSPVVRLTNLTVANHPGNGIQFNNTVAGGTATLYNTISVDNGDNAVLSGTIDSANNLLSGSAGFLDATAGKYSLTYGSPAVDAGTNSPPGGLGLTDINGNDRIDNGTVDQGAYELDVDLIFSDGFE